MLPDNNLDKINGAFVAEHFTFDSATFPTRGAHYHNGYEFYLYLGNEPMTYLIGSHSYRINKYDLVFIDQETYHHCIYHNQTVERYLVQFTENVLNVVNQRKLVEEALQQFRHSPVMRFKENITQKIICLMEELIPLSSGKNSLLSDIALIYFVLTIKDYCDQQFQETIVPIPANSSKIMDIINYLLKNYDQKISLDELAERFFMSKYYMCRIFRETMGQSIIDYLNERRLIEAARLLISSHLTVLEISLKVGFNNAAHFNTLFKRRFGKTPLQYRKSLQE